MLSRIGICLLAGGLLAGSAIRLDAAETARPAPFRHGATLVEFFNFPKTTGDDAAKRYANPPFPDVSEKLASFDWDGLRRAGFDNFRVPVNLGPMMTGSEDDRRAIIAQLTTVVAELGRHDLSVLVTLYPPSLSHELPETYLDGFDGPRFHLYFDNVMRVASALRQFPAGTVALEPMNEPQSDCRKASGLDWTDYQQFMIDRIRDVAPDMYLFLTGACWSNIDGVVLLDSDLLRDERNFVSVHFYYPFIFTHQTSTWTAPWLAGTVGVPYPASAGSEAKTLELTRERFATVELAPEVNRGAALLAAAVEIARYFHGDRGRPTMEKWLRRVADWQKRQDIPAERIVFTEFGAMKAMNGSVEVDKASRARWLHDAASLIEKHGWGWNVYVLRDDPFGLYVNRDYPDLDLDPDLMRALGLKSAP